MRFRGLGSSIMSKFQNLEFYKTAQSSYTLLPFRFTALDRDRYVLTNAVGEYLITTREKVFDFVEHKLSHEDSIYTELRARHFLIDESSAIAPELLAIKLRTKYERLAEFTGLHIFVVTLRCEHSCPYCQVSRQSEDKTAFDMTLEIAEKSLALVFQSPSP